MLIIYAYMYVLITVMFARKLSKLTTKLGIISNISVPNFQCNYVILKVFKLALKYWKYLDKFMDKFDCFAC